MKLHYDQQTDSLFIELSDERRADSRQMSDGVVTHFDEHGEMIGMVIDHASEKLDLDSLATTGLLRTAAKSG